MGRTTRQAVLFFFAGSLMLTAGASGVRANDPCVANGTTLLCQGDQADGIDVTNTVYDTLVVDSLTSRITTADVAGILFFTDSGGPLTLRSDPGPFGIWTTGIFAYGIFVNSEFFSSTERQRSRSAGYRFSTLALLKSTGTSAEASTSARPWT